MPVYTYHILNDDGTKGDYFEVEHPISEPPLEKYSITGEPDPKY